MEPKTTTEAVAAIMAEIGPIAKTGQGSNRGRRIDEVISELNPIMARHGVTVVPSRIVDWAHQDWGQTRNGALRQKLTAVIEYTIHGPGEPITAMGIAEGVDTEDKNAGKVMSYALKYVLCQVFAIPTYSKDDVEDNTGEQYQRTAPTHNPGPQDTGADPGGSAPSADPRLELRQSIADLFRSLNDVQKDTARALMLNTKAGPKGQMWMTEKEDGTTWLAPPDRVTVDSANDMYDKLFEISQVESGEPFLEEVQS